MRLILCNLSAIVLLTINPYGSKTSNKSNTGINNINDTIFLSLKNVDINYMLRGYFYAASSIEDKYAPGGFGGSNNNAKAISENEKLKDLSGLQIIINTTAYVRFAENFRGQKVFLVNRSGSIAGINASDSRLPIIAEVFYNDTWSPVEYLPSSWCGNSHHKVYLKDNEYWEFIVPRYQGKIKVKLRYRMDSDKGNILYSNEIFAFINKKQFSEKQGHSPQGIMDPYKN